MHQDTKSARLIAVCKRSLRLLTMIFWSNLTLFWSTVRWPYFGLRWPYFGQPISLTFLFVFHSNPKPCRRQIDVSRPLWEQQLVPLVNYDLRARLVTADRAG